MLSPALLNFSEPPPFKLVNKIATNILLSSLRINIIQKHIPYLTNVVQAQRETLHLIINKRQTGSRRHFTLKSKLLQVNFYFVLAKFHIMKALFSLVFPTYVPFCTHLVVPYCFKPFQKPTFFALLEKSDHMISSSLSTVLQVTNNQLISTIYESFNLRQTKSRFLNNHQTIKIPFYRSAW